MRVRRNPVASVLALAGFGFLWIPLVVVLVNSFNQDVVMSHWGGFTGNWYSRAFNDADVRAGLRATMVIALLSTAVSVVLAVSAVLWWRHAPGAARRTFDTFVYARIILPEVVFAVALFFLFQKVHFQLGTGAIIIGHTVWNSAYATVIIQARMMGVDPSVEEAAADLGATPWRVFRRVTLAMMMPGIIAAALIAFTFSFDDVVTSYFLGGASQAPLPIVLFGMIRFQITPEINAIGVMIMLFTITLMTAAVVLLAAAGSVGRRTRSAVPSIYR